VKFGIALALASLLTLTGLSAIAGTLSLPAFHDGMAAPKTIAVVVAHRVDTNLIGIR
jgi:hypothetical protein